MGYHERAIRLPYNLNISVIDKLNRGEYVTIGDTGFGDELIDVEQSYCRAVGGIGAPHTWLRMQGCVVQTGCKDCWSRPNPEFHQLHAPFLFPC